MLNERLHLAIKWQTFLVWFTSVQKCWSWKKWSPEVCFTKGGVWENIQSNAASGINMDTCVQTLRAPSSCQVLESCGESVSGLYGSGIPEIIRSKICHLRVRGGRGGMPEFSCENMPSLCAQTILHICVAIKRSPHSVANQPIFKETSAFIGESDQWTKLSHVTKASYSNGWSMRKKLKSQC